MAYFPDKFKATTAVVGRHKDDLSCEHITTASWMQFNVAYIREIRPGQEIELENDMICRLAPLARPTFGRAMIKNRVFLVKHENIYPGWNDFIADTQHIPYNQSLSGVLTGLHTIAPQITNNNLIGLFVNGTGNNSFLDTQRNGLIANASYYDVLVHTPTADTYYLLTNQGRQLLKILHQCGYGIVWDVADTTTYNALPLLAVLKVYIDWYFPMQYAYLGVYAQLQSLLKYDSPVNIVVPPGALSIIADTILFVSYDADYFTSCWDNPVTPNDGLFSQHEIPDVTVTGAYTPSGVTSIPTSANKGTPTGFTSVSGAQNVTNNIRGLNFTQYLVDSLHRLTDYLKRHQLAGSRAADRLLARTGLVLESAKDHVSKMLGHEYVPIQIGPVFSQSDTIGLNSSSPSKGTSLGDYGGKGLGTNLDENGRGRVYRWKNDSSDWYHIIMISTIIPAIGYYQGVDRFVLHQSKLDWYTEEFDALGVQAVSALELFCPDEGTAPSALNLRNQVFGFLPRYAEYKTAKDKVTGDYRYKSYRNNGAEDSWHLLRDVEAFFDSATDPATDLVHSLSFVQGRDAIQYNRIFLNSSPDQDLFRLEFHFQVTSWQGGKPLYDTYDFAEDGKSIVLDAGGPKVN